MLTRILSLTAMLGVAAGAANANDANFVALDADASGGLTLTEVQAAMPDVTQDDFARYDAEMTGDLSEEEFGAWLAATTGMKEE